MSTNYVVPATKAVGIAQANPKSAGAAPSPHIVGSGSSSTVEANRQAFEVKAGADGAKLLLRSTPSRAQVWLNGLPVGSTPLLLIVPAGKYAVEMRRSRTETRRQEVALLPKETREVVMKMQALYPSRVITAAH